MECDFCDIEIVKYSDDDGNNGYILHIIELGQRRLLCVVDNTYTICDDDDNEIVALFPSHQAATAMKKRLFQQYMRDAVLARLPTPVHKASKTIGGIEYYVYVCESAPDTFDLTMHESEAARFYSQKEANDALQQALLHKGEEYLQ